MKRSFLVPHQAAIGFAIAAALVVGVLFTSVASRADITVRIDIGNAPPAPHIVFLTQPHEVRYPGDMVYVVDDSRAGDNDCFRYESYYWVFSDGYWYRAASWRGPFLVVDPRSVPTVFYQRPAMRWKHRPSGPPVFTNTAAGGSSKAMHRSSGSPQQPMNRSVSRPTGQKSGGTGSMSHMKRTGSGSQGVAKKSGKGPAKPAKDVGKGNDKGNDKGGGHGGK